MGSRFQEGGLSYTIADQVAVAGHDQMKISAYQQPKKQLSYTIRERISPELYAKLQDAPAGSKEIPTSVPNHERISSNVQAIFDRFSTHVCRGDIKDDR